MTAVRRFSPTPGKLIAGAVLHCRRDAVFLLEKINQRP
jgi:hypothetical protein